MDSLFFKPVLKRLTRKTSMNFSNNTSNRRFISKKHSKRFIKGDNRTSKFLSRPVVKQPKVSKLDLLMKEYSNDNNALVKCLSKLIMNELDNLSSLEYCRSKGRSLNLLTKSKEKFNKQIVDESDKYSSYEIKQQKRNVETHNLNEKRMHALAAEKQNKNTTQKWDQISAYGKKNEIKKHLFNLRNSHLLDATLSTSELINVPNNTPDVSFSMDSQSYLNDDIFDNNAEVIVSDNFQHVNKCNLPKVRNLYKSEELNKASSLNLINELPVMNDIVKNTNLRENIDLTTHPEKWQRDIDNLLKQKTNINKGMGSFESVTSDLSTEIRNTLLTHVSLLDNFNQSVSKEIKDNKNAIYNDNVLLTKSQVREKLNDKKSTKNIINMIESVLFKRISLADENEKEDKLEDKKQKIFLENNVEQTSNEDQLIRENIAHTIENKKRGQSLNDIYNLIDFRLADENVTGSKPPKLNNRDDDITGKNIKRHSSSSKSNLILQTKDSEEFSGSSIECEFQNARNNTQNMNSKFKSLVDGSESKTETTKDVVDVNFQNNITEIIDEDRESESNPKQEIMNDEVDKLNSENITKSSKKTDKKNQKEKKLSKDKVKKKKEKSESKKNRKTNESNDKPNLGIHLTEKDLVTTRGGSKEEISENKFTNLNDASNKVTLEDKSSTESSFKIGKELKSDKVTEKDLVTKEEVSKKEISENKFTNLNDALYKFTPEDKSSTESSFKIRKELKSESTSNQELNEAADNTQIKHDDKNDEKGSVQSQNKKKNDEINKLKNTTETEKKIDADEKGEKIKKNKKNKKDNKNDKEKKKKEKSKNKSQNLNDTSNKFTPELNSADKSSTESSLKIGKELKSESTSSQELNEATYNTQIKHDDKNDEKGSVQSQNEKKNDEVKKLKDPTETEKRNSGNEDDKEKETKPVKGEIKKIKGNLVKSNSDSTPGTEGDAPIKTMVNGDEKSKAVKEKVKELKENLVKSNSDSTSCTEYGLPIKNENKPNDNVQKKKHKENNDKLKVDNLEDYFEKKCKEKLREEYLVESNSDYILFKEVDVMIKNVVKEDKNKPNNKAKKKKHEECNDILRVNDKRKSSSNESKISKKLEEHDDEMKFKRNKIASLKHLSSKNTVPSTKCTSEAYLLETRDNKINDFSIVSEYEIKFESSKRSSDYEINKRNLMNMWNRPEKDQKETVKNSFNVQTDLSSMEMINNKFQLDEERCMDYLLNEVQVADTFDITELKNITFDQRCRVCESRFNSCVYCGCLMDSDRIPIPNVTEYVKCCKCNCYCKKIKCCPKKCHSIDKHNKKPRCKFPNKRKCLPLRMSTSSSEDNSWDLSCSSQYCKVEPLRRIVCVSR